MAVSTEIGVIEPGTSLWPAQIQSEQLRTLYTIGDAKLLTRELLGIFCSSKCPGNIILQSYDAVRAIRDRETAVAGGFHSPLEKECLDLLMRGSGAIVIALARGLSKMRVPNDWKPLIDRRQLLIVSPFHDKHETTTGERAELRNHFVAELSQQLFVPHAANGSKTEALCEFWLRRGKDVLLLDPDCQKLFGQGARMFELSRKPLE